MSKIRTASALAGFGALVFAGMAHASGLPMATEWDWARDGGRIFNAAVVLGVLGYIVVKFTIPVVRKRAEDIRHEFEELVEAREMAERSLADYAKKLEAMKVEQSRALAEAKAEAEAIRARIIAQAEEAAAATLKRAGEQIEIETEQARARLRAETTLLAIAAAEEILRKNIKPEDQKALLADYMAKLGRSN